MGLPNYRYPTQKGMVYAIRSQEDISFYFSWLEVEAVLSSLFLAAKSPSLLKRVLFCWSLKRALSI